MATHSLTSSFEEWLEAARKTPERDALFTTLSGEEIKPLYTEQDLPEQEEIGLPGQHRRTAEVAAVVHLLRERHGGPPVPLPNRRVEGGGAEGVAEKIAQEMALKSQLLGARCLCCCPCFPRCPNLIAWGCP